MDISTLERRFSCAEDNRAIHGTIAWSTSKNPVLLMGIHQSKTSQIVSKASVKICLVISWSARRTNWRVNSWDPTNCTSKRSCPAMSRREPMWAWVSMFPIPSGSTSKKALSRKSGQEEALPSCSSHILTAVKLCHIKVSECVKQRYPSEVTIVRQLSLSCSNFWYLRKRSMSCSSSIQRKIVNIIAWTVSIPEGDRSTTMARVGDPRSCKTNWC